MKNEINDIIKMIDKHFNKVVWNAEPPVHDTDINLLVLATKIIAMRNSIETIDIKKTVNELLEEMQKMFNMPYYSNEIKQWLNKDIVRHSLILKVYEKLGALRFYY